MSLAWARPAGVFSDFQVQYLAAADTLQTHETARQDITLTGLRPHTLYTFTVVVSTILCCTGRYHLYMPTYVNSNIVKLS